MSEPVRGNGTFRPFGRRVLVRPVREDPSGLVVPESARARTEWGVIVAVGTDVREHDPVEGARVLYPRHAAVELPLGRERLALVDIDEVLGLMDDGTKEVRADE